MRNFIVKELAELTTSIKIVVKKQSMANLLRTAQGILSDLNTKLVFLRTYDGMELSNDQVLEIRDELNVFQHGNTIAEFLFAFQEYCTL